MTPLRKHNLLTNTRATFLLISTFLLGCILATGVAKLLEKPQNVVVDHPNTDVVDLRDVFVLNKTIAEGRKIQPQDLTVVRKHKDQIPQGAVKTYRQIEGRNARSELPKGTLLLDEFFANVMTQGRIQGYIPPGFHSVPIQIYETTNDGNNSPSAVIPGDQVDIILVSHSSTDNQPNEPEACVLMEKIPVLDTVWDQADHFSHHEKRGTVSLLLSDTQRQNLWEESQEGKRIRLRVCSATDIQTAVMVPPPVFLDTPGPYIASQVATENVSRELENPSPPSGNGGQIEIVIRSQAERLPTSGAGLRDEASRVSSAAGNPKPDSILPDSPFSKADGLKGYDRAPGLNVVTKFPVVYERNGNVETQARGVTRESGVYHSVQ